MSVKIEKVDVVPQLELGEAPYWDADTGSLYFVEVFKGQIHNFIPATNEHYWAPVGQRVSAIVPVKGQKQKFLIILPKSLATIIWDGKSSQFSNLTEICKLDKDKEDNVLNDGKSDSSGRFWTGTYNPDAFDSSKSSTYQPKGSLYKVEDNKFKEQFAPVGGSNGLTWSPDNKKMYFIDSKEAIVLQYDFDINSGSIANPTTLISTKEANLKGFFDGMTVDSDGNLWIAMFSGQQIIQVDTKKTNTVLRSITLPAKCPTCLTFGGKNLDELYVTTGTWDFLQNDKLKAEDGLLYKITGLGVHGFKPSKVFLN